MCCNTQPAGVAAQGYSCCFCCCRAIVSSRSQPCSSQPQQSQTAPQASIWTATCGPPCPPRCTTAHPARAADTALVLHFLAGRCLPLLTVRVAVHQLLLVMRVAAPQLAPPHTCCGLHAYFLSIRTGPLATGSSSSTPGGASSTGGADTCITLQPPPPPLDDTQRQHAAAALRRAKQRQQQAALHASTQLDLLVLHPMSLFQQYSQGVGVYAGRAAAACQTRQLEQDIREQDCQTDTVGAQHSLWCGLLSCGFEVCRVRQTPNVPHASSCQRWSCVLLTQLLLAMHDRNCM